jgi:hypothetical protein
MEGMMNNKWQIGPVKLASGSEAEITRINEGQEDFCYVGNVMIGATWHPAGWHASGRMMYHEKTGNNLAPPPKKTVRVKAWLMVSPNGYIAPLYDESEAIANAKKHGFALIEIDREVTEGEGL